MSETSVSIARLLHKHKFTVDEKLKVIIWSLE